MQNALLHFELSFKEKFTFYQFSVKLKESLWLVVAQRGLSVIQRN